MNGGFFGVFGNIAGNLFDVFGLLMLNNFVFSFRVGQNPVRQAAGEAARSTWDRRLTKARTRRGLFEIGLAFFRLFHRLDGCGTRAVLRQALARQNDIVLAGFGGRRAAITATVATVVAAILVTAAWTAVAAAVRRSIFGWREIASTLATLMASTAAAASTSATAPASTASAAAIAATISTAVTAAIMTLALSSAVVAARRIVASGIVVGSKILRRRGVGFGLALVHRVMLDFFAGRRGGFGAIVMIDFFVVFVMRFAGGFIEMQNFFAHADGFAGQAFDGGAAAVAMSGRRRAVLLVTMAVIVIFQIFENVADVQESVAI